MTTPVMFQTVPGALVHYVDADNPECVAEEVVYKSCRVATILDVTEDMVTLATEPGDPLLTARHDGVSLPKIERGPSGREVGTWHHVEMCG